MGEKRLTNLNPIDKIGLHDSARGDRSSSEKVMSIRKYVGTADIFQFSWTTANPSPLSFYFFELVLLFHFLNA